MRRTAVSNAFVSAAPSGTAGRVPRAPSIESFGTVDGDRRGLAAADEQLRRVELAGPQQRAADLRVGRREVEDHERVGLPATICWASES